MVTHARFCHPEEACGLLASAVPGRLRFAYPLTNIEASRTSYTVDPTEHFRALQHAEARGWELTGVFHSHPHSEAFPSATDVAKALEPDWLYVIVSLADRDEPLVRAFWIREGHIAEETLEPLG